MAPTDRLPPHDLLAERSILGGILRDPDTLTTAQLVLTADSFYTYAHQKIFLAFEGLEVERKPLDLVTLHDRLRAAGQIEDVGGISYIVDLYESVATGMNVEYHSAIVRDCHITRRVMQESNSVLRDCYDRCMTGDELASMMEQRARAVTDGSSAAAGPRPIGDICREYLTAMDERLAHGKTAGLATGLVDLDGMICGLSEGQLITIGARTSVGKSALAVTIAANVASAGTPVLFVSLEMAARELAERVLAMGSGVPTHRFTRGNQINATDADDLTAAAGSGGLGRCPIFIDDSPGQSAPRIAAGVRRAVARHRVGLVVVDYLQLITPDDRRENRATQVAEITASLKRMARSCKVPVLALAQLNRESDKENRKPRLSDFRESGGVEQDSDKVILLHRGADQPQDADVLLIEAIIAKHRNGPTGEVTLAYRRGVTRFENAARGQGW